jgi:D-alanyl-lipoteichoic acid acyltransferase DltB (MBOAT superfamily)
VLFNSLAFAWFFATVFVVSWALSSVPKARFYFLAGASYVFYSGLDLFSWKVLTSFRELGLWHGLLKNAPYLEFVPIVFIGSTVDYFLALWIARTQVPGARKLLVFATVAMNTGLLLVFKYWDFLAEQVIALGGADHRLHLPLPIGISFFTFMSLSYVIDVYRRELEPCRNYAHYVTYIAFFPHLVAGPIIRGKDLLPQFAKAVSLTSAAAGEGMFLVAVGLFKKVVVSDYLATNLVSRVVAEPTSFSSVEVATAMFGYAIQIYCDFSGYSDVAIGIALLLGYRLKLNFDAPFVSGNLVEFWRRWHISLSSWLRDYIYIPLGGSRAGKVRKYFNVWVTMVICGIWHGAAWSYVIFGVVQGLAVALSHAAFDWVGKRPGDAADGGITLRRLPAVLVTFVFTTLTFVLIRAPLPKAILMYRQLFVGSTFVPNIHPLMLVAIAGGLVLQWIPKSLYHRAKDEFIRAPAVAQAVVLFLLALVLRHSASAEAVPFVYGQF